MKFGTLIKLVLLISAFSVLAATYGTRVLLYLETGRGSTDVTCDQKTDEQMATDDGRADLPEDQRACWSTLEDTRPQLLTDTPPEAVTDTPSESVTDRPLESVTDRPFESVIDKPTVALQ
jgi:hypothetical protein